MKSQRTLTITDIIYFLVFGDRSVKYTLVFILLNRMMLL